MWNIVNRVPWDRTPPSTLIVLHQQKPRDSGRVGAGKAKRMKIPQKEVFLRHWQDMQTRLPKEENSQNSLDTIVLSEYWLIANRLLEN